MHNISFMHLCLVTLATLFLMVAALPLSMLALLVAALPLSSNSAIPARAAKMTESIG